MDSDTYKKVMSQMKELSDNIAKKKEKKDSNTKKEQEENKSKK